MPTLMFKIERLPGGGEATLRLIGRLQAQHLPELTTQMAGDPRVAALDLNEVILVDVDVVRFLGRAESGGVRLLHCAPFIREWICREKDELEQ
jgi:hypothetical protein